MRQGKLEDRLQMRRLTVDGTAQYNALLRYAFQVTDSELASLGWNQKEMERSKKPVLKKTESFGWFDGEKLASQISVYPMQVNLFGTMYNMGGVTGVATYPEYMGRGLVAHLMKKALDNMRENHQCVSMLFPYLIPYYRKKGWEIVSDKMTYTIKDTQLPKHHKVGGMVERVDIDSEDVHRVHDAFSAMRHGALKRNELEWEEYWRWEADDVLGRRVLRRERKADRIPRLLYRQRRVPHQRTGLYQSGGAARPVELYLRPFLDDRQGCRQQLHQRADGVSAGRQRNSGGNRAVYHGAGSSILRVHPAVSV